MTETTMPAPDPSSPTPGPAEAPIVPQGPTEPASSPAPPPDPAPSSAPAPHSNQPSPGTGAAPPAGAEGSPARAPLPTPPGSAPADVSVETVTNPPEGPETGELQAWDADPITAEAAAKSEADRLAAEKGWSIPEGAERAAEAEHAGQ